jgi:hypothetical protein
MLIPEPSLVQLESRMDVADMKEIESLEDYG